jgi:hypothetical protein
MNLSVKKNNTKYSKDRLDASRFVLYCYKLGRNMEEHEICTPEWHRKKYNFYTVALVNKDFDHQVNHTKCDNVCKQSGYLKKITAVRKRSHARFFVLEVNSLDYYVDESLENLKGSISLASILEIKSDTKQDKTKSNTFRIRAQNKEYCLEALSPVTKQEWIIALKKVTSCLPSTAPMTVCTNCSCTRFKPHYFDETKCKDCYHSETKHSKPIKMHSTKITTTKITTTTTTIQPV